MANFAKISENSMASRVIRASDNDHLDVDRDKSEPETEITNTLSEWMKRNGWN